YFSFIFSYILDFLFFFFSSRRRHTRFSRDWSSDVCSSDLPVDRDLILSRIGKRNVMFVLLAAFMVRTQLLILFFKPTLGALPRLCADELTRHRHTPRCIENMNYRTFIGRVDLYGGMDAGSSRPSYQQGKRHLSSLHLFGHVHHFIQRGCDQSAQADYIYLLGYGRVQYLFRRYHHAKVDDVVVVTRQDDAHDIFAYVVHVSFD